jgi:DNA-binding transcriptional ArsR family regulator
VARARRVLRRARLPLLSALALDGPGYVPDFLVRHTPPGRVLAELEALHGGRPLNGLAGTELPGEVRRAMARGGAHVARQAADELRRFWDLAYAPHWEAAKAVLDAEVDRCAGVLARQGAAKLFGSLHPGVRWADGTLHVDSRLRIVLPDVPLVVVVPSVVTPRPAAHVDPTYEEDRPPTLVYPVRETAIADALAPAAPSAEMAQLLGPTRAGLLAALTRPATTGELAARHFLSPATVSNHLGVLHRAGLVTRSRTGRSVLYRRSRRETD